MPLPAEESFRCEIMSWMKVVKDAKRLSRIIKNSGYYPHMVVAIGRGGFVPARILCDYLLIKDLATIKVEHWGIAATPMGEAVIKFPLCADIRQKKVLLVDDITDTGETLRVSLEHLKGFEPKEIRTAVLIHKITSDLIPDYFVKRIVRWRWVIFPWALWEDLVGFVSRITTSGIRRPEDISRELRRRYHIDVSIETIKDILSEAKLSKVS
jgi:hypoxanthine phosphoribosyltransferase